MENKTLIYIAGAALAFWGISKLTGRRTTNQSNDTTTNIDDINTRQAQEFYNLLGVKRVGSSFVATPVLLSATTKKIAYLAENVADWSKIQAAFSKLCGNSYTVTEAISTAVVNTNDLTTINNLLSGALKKQALFAKIATTAYKNDNGVLTAMYNYDKGAYLGRCVQSDTASNGYYYFINWQTGIRVCVMKTHCTAETLK